MKAIVFGGSGFLGSHVADALTESGHTVTVYDIKPSKYLRSDQKMIVGDVLDTAKVEKAVEAGDIVFNFAGVSDIEEANKNPLLSVCSNIMGNTIILEACRKSGAKRFIFASTLYVYGKAGSFYKSTKQACELLIENYYELYGIPYTILRYGSLYGPRADERNFIHKIIRQAIHEGKITREGDGEEIREYIHVRDAARGTVDILSEEFKNEYVIITGNQQMKVKDLLMMIREVMDNKIKIEYLPAKDKYHYEITPYNFAPRLAKRVVGKTYFDLGQGILEGVHSAYSESNHHAMRPREKIERKKKAAV